MITIHNLLQYGLAKTVQGVVVIEAVELKEPSASIMRFNAVHLVKKKHNIAVKDSIVLCDAGGCLAWYNDRNTPVILVVNGEKILHRKIDGQEHIESAALLRKLIPGVIPEEFYTQLYIYREGSSFLSVVRRSYVQQVQEELDTLKMKPVHVAVGPFPFLSGVMAFIPPSATDYDLVFMNYTFSFKGDDLCTYKIAPYRQPDRMLQLRAGSEKINEALVVAYSYGLLFFVDPLDVPGIDVKAIKQVRDNFVFSTLGKPLIAAMSILLFIILLCSSLVFNIYNRKYNDLQVQVSERQLQYEHNRQLQQQRMERWTMLQKNGLDKRSRIAFYADQVAGFLPDEIYLRKLVVHPAAGNDSYLFDNTRILVYGNCYSGDELNTWLDRVRKFGWVKSAIVKEFKLSSADIIGSFSVEIIKKQD